MLCISEGVENQTLVDLYFSALFALTANIGITK